MVDDLSVGKIDDALGTLVRRAQVPRAQERVAARAGLVLDRAAYPLLRGISEHDTVRASEVAHDLSLDVSTVSRQIKELEAEGLVARRPDPSDGRASVLTLTVAGTQALERLRQARRELLAEVLSGWDELDRQTLADLMCRLADDFAAHQGSQ